MSTFSDIYADYIGSVVEALQDAALTLGGAEPNRLAGAMEAIEQVLLHDSSDPAMEALQMSIVGLPHNDGLRTAGLAMLNQTQRDAIAYAAQVGLLGLLAAAGEMGQGWQAANTPAVEPEECPECPEAPPAAVGGAGFLLGMGAGALAYMFISED